MCGVSHADRTADLFLRYGYDPADPVPRDDDGQRVIPERLIDVVAAAPVLSPREIGRVNTMAEARAVETMRRYRTDWRRRWVRPEGPPIVAVRLWYARRLPKRRR